MAAGDTENVRIWTGAEVFVGTTSTPAPTDTTTALNAGFEPLGLIDQDDAIGEEFSSDDTEHYAYGSVLVRKTSIKSKTTLTMTALENSDLVYGIAFPGSDSETAGGVTTRTNRPKNLGLAIRSFVLEKTDGDVVSRLYIPRGQVTIAGSRSTSDNEMYGTPLLIDLLGSTDEGGSYFSIEITDDPAAEVAGS
jgi:hypothetical protein